MPLPLGLEDAQEPPVVRRFRVHGAVDDRHDMGADLVGTQIPPRRELIHLLFPHAPLGLKRGQVRVVIERNVRWNLVRERQDEALELHPAVDVDVPIADAVTELDDHGSCSNGLLCDRKPLAM